MRYVVLGVGAVGGTLAGQLVEGGAEVLALARGAHAEAIRSHGLRLATPERVVQVPLEVADEPAALRLRPDDVLVLATKSQDTAAVLDAVAALPVGGRTAAEALPVLCAQNGVANERAALRRFARVQGVCVMLPAVHLAPGRVEAYGTPLSGIFEVGCYPTGSDQLTADVCAQWSASGFLATPRTDVMAWKYAKLLRNLGNALEALFGSALAGDELARVQRLDQRARDEALACLAAAGIEVVDDERWLAHRGALVETAPVEGVSRAGGSTWQSLARGAGSVESDYLNGEIALLGRLHGVATPVNDALQVESRRAAREGSRPGTGSAELLDRLTG